jgi:ubiquitin carboxyl-terminal hydrolase 4/11/15
LINKKPYVPAIEAETDVGVEEYARKSWVAYSRRNCSLISDVFYGQFKTRIECPDCGKVSITFDPYQLISLPIQTTFSVNLEIYYIDAYHKEKALKFEPTLMSIKREFDDLEVQDLIDQLAGQLDRKSDDFYLVFVGFSTRGSLVEFKSSMAAVAAKQLDLQYRPKLFLFEKTDEDRQILANDSKDDIILTFGKTILEKEKKRGMLGHYGGSINNEEYPTFVKPFFGLKNYPVSYLYRRIFEKLVHFIPQFDTYLAENPKPDYTSLFEKYMCSESNGEKTDPKDLLFHLKIDEKVYGPTDQTPLAELFNKNTWNDEKNEFSYIIIFSEKESKKQSVDFDQMKTCAGHNSEIKIKSSGDLEKNKSFPLESLFEKFREPEQLDSENKWYCSRCKDHVQATIKMDVYKVPEILIIQMKK